MFWLKVYEHFIEIRDPDRCAAVRVFLTLAAAAAWCAALFL